MRDPLPRSTHARCCAGFDLQLIFIGTHGNSDGFPLPDLDPIQFKDTTFSLLPIVAF
jgi:hypothetical protein